MRKMEPLNRYLGALASEKCRFTFTAIEQILGSKLPNSARNYAAWWANDATPGRQSWAWLEAGFRTIGVNLARGEISFGRSSPMVSKRPKTQVDASQTLPSCAPRTTDTDALDRGSKPLGRYDLAFVSCAKLKRNSACAAKDLYISSRFKWSRLIAEHHAGCWFILSARHGLVDPNEVVAPYEQTLKAAKVVERREWARRVFEAICHRAPAKSTILLLAGFDYAGQLVPLLKGRGHAVSQPLEGLSQGRGLSLLSRLAAACR